MLLFVTKQKVTKNSPKVVSPLFETAHFATAIRTSNGVFLRRGGRILRLSDGIADYRDIVLIRLYKLFGICKVYLSFIVGEHSICFRKPNRGI